MKFLRISSILLSLTAVTWGQTDTFTSPQRLQSPMVTEYRQINSAAPPAPYPRAKDALQLPLLSINEALTDTIMDDIKAGLQYVLQTRNDFTFPIHGTATTATHAVLDNLIEPVDKVIVAVNGYWSNLMADMVSRLGARLIRLEKSPGSRFSVSEIESALKLYRPKLLAIVQGESSTSTFQPLEGIGDLCHRYGVLSIIDVVAVAGIQPVFTDKLKLDAVFTSSHKGLGGVVGLAPVSLSSRAVAKIKSRIIPPRAYQTDLTLQAQLWNTSQPDRVRFQSLSLPVMYSLREALATISEEQMESTYSRHVAANQQLDRGMAELGLVHFVPHPDHRLLAITSYQIPGGKDPYKIANYMFQNYNIEISTGFGSTKGKVLRIAIFASNADPTIVKNIIKAMNNALATDETNSD